MVYPVPSFLGHTFIFICEFGDYTYNKRFPSLINNLSSNECRHHVAG